jgi:hypothetical protein
MADQDKPKPFKCPDCGRFSRDGWEVAISEFNVSWGAICSVHGDWQDSS